MTSLRKTAVVGLSLGLLTIPPSVKAATGFDALTFKPASDHGFYLMQEQSQTLGRGKFAIGVTGEVSNDSLQLRTGGTVTQDVIQEQVGLHLGTAFGLADWLNLGAKVSGVPYQNFITPVTLTEDNGGRMGDIQVDMKVRVVDNEIAPIGIALVPFITFPTGNEQHFVGNGKVTGGGHLVIDTARIADRVSFAVNAGAQIRDGVTLSPGAQTIDDQFHYGAGMNIGVAEPVHVLAEVNGWTPFENFFEDGNRNIEIDGGLRFLLGSSRSTSITLGGGTGLQKVAGAPGWRAFTILAFRPAHAEEAPPPMPAPMPVTEEVIRTNKVHFAFNKSEIRPDSYPILEEILDDIKNRSQVENVRIEGHTDSVGSADYNQQLSEKRANAVRTFMIEKGYPAKKLEAVGMGEANPIADNETKDGRAQNRRVEFHLQLKPGSAVKVKKKQEPSPTYKEGEVESEKRDRTPGNEEVR